MHCNNSIYLPVQLTYMMIEYNNTKHHVQIIEDNAGDGIVVLCV